jgi:hypothetical protein
VKCLVVQGLLEVGLDNGYVFSITDTGSKYNTINTIMFYSRKWAYRRIEVQYGRYYQDRD